MVGLSETEPAKPVPKASTLGVLDCFVIAYIAYSMESQEDWNISYPSNNNNRWLPVQSIASKMRLPYNAVYRRVAKLRESGLIMESPN